MFISLKFKALILTSTLVMGLSIFFAMMGESQLENLYSSQRKESDQRHKNETIGLIQQSNAHLQQLSDIIPTLSSSQDNATTEDIIKTHWEYLQINWGLETAELYNYNGNKLNRWGRDINSKELNSRVIDSAKTGNPISLIDCTTQCFQILITPIYSTNGNQVLILARTLSDILNTFSTLNESNMGLLSKTIDKEENTRTISNWGYQVTAISNFEKTLPLLKKSSEKIDFTNLKKTSQTASVNDDRFQISIIPIEDSVNENYFIIIEDVTAERTQIENSSKSYIAGAIAAVIVFSTLIIAMLWRPITRLRKQAELMPLLSQGEFEYVRKALTSNSRKFWFKDEIDILDSSEMEVSLQLENMQHQIQSHNEELQQLVLFDSLTGLANRRALLDEIQICFSNKSESFALLFLDLDNFKRINDSLGHRCGDELLKVVGKRLRSCVRGSDMVARLGGDEFCILVRTLRNENDGRIVATNILNILKNPIKLKTTELIMSASIGIVTAPKDGTNTEDLLQNADLAMYKAKALGRNKYQLFEQAMTENAVEQLSLENELRKALINHEFVLYYQPQINLKTNEICSVEALVRWQHPERGLLAPGHFISALEETGLIVPLGEWVLLESCEALKRWLEQGISPIKMSVNLSSRQFQDPKLYQMVEQTLAFTQVPAQLLELEVTESMVMQDIENNNRVLMQLQQLGMSIAIDDFGTGYSSFSYLKALPLDTLKIDRSFVMDIPNDETDMEITAAIIAVAHKLKLKVVAEGIETSEQQQFLVDEGCDIGQGYLFSKPIAEDKLIYLLVNHEPEPAFIPSHA